jgi:membrane dipeptidase
MTLLWEQHCCLPLTTSADVGELARYHRPGGTFVSVNVASGPTTPEAAQAVLAHFRAGIAAHPALTLAGTVADIAAARASGQVAVAFDLEDATPLGGDLSLLPTYADLGVRTMLPTYNRNNEAGSGCLDPTDTGLTSYGRALVQACNEAGVVIDGTHGSRRSGLQIASLTNRPMIYSHVAMHALHPHPRNITDDQARACAETDGVIAITGVRHLLGQSQDPLLTQALHHISHLLDLVGPRHIGLATDYVFDQTNLLTDVATNPALYPPADPPRGPTSYMTPEEFLQAPTALATLGLSPTDQAALLSQNFTRVAAATWPT